MKVSQDKALRPVDWDSYIGQDKVKNRLKMQIKGAKGRDQALGHILLTGNPGTGKTSLSSLIAEEMGMDFNSMMITPSLKVSAINQAVLDWETDDGGVLLMDEIHNFSRRDQHYLYSILEDHVIALDSGRFVPIETPLTIIGATTDPGQLSKALYDRFDFKHRLDFYTDEEMTNIVEAMADKAKVKLNRGECIRLGKASAGTPRQARVLVYAARDLPGADIDEILAMTGITPEGLTEDHVDYLQSLSDLGGQSGIENIVNHSGRPREILIEVEKLLVQRNFIELQRKGRVLMMPGLKVLRTINNNKKDGS